MNPAFVILVTLLCVAVWFVLSTFEGALFKIIKEIFNELKGEKEKEDKEN